jgi:ABC-type dipeptide/oligopeptide/nickel transport system permease subunit
MIIVAIGANVFSPYAYYEMRSKPILMPSWQHPMGTDDFGRDLFSRVIYGARVSIMVGFLSQLVVIILGIFIGGIAGFFGGRTDSVLMRITDVQFTFPPMLIALILLGTVVSRSLFSIIIVIGITSWPTMARLVRSQVLSIKQNTYIEAAQVYGASPKRLLFRHILPNILGPVIVQATFGVANAIMIEAFLSFIGLGIPPPMPSWGGILYGSFPWIRVAPSLLIFPAAALSVTLIAINLAGDGLRDALDPKSERYSQI